MLEFRHNHFFMSELPPSDSSDYDLLAEYFDPPELSHLSSEELASQLESLWQKSAELDEQIAALQQHRQTTIQEQEKVLKAVGDLERRQSELEFAITRFRENLANCISKLKQGYRHNATREQAILLVTSDQAQPAYEVDKPLAGEQRLAIRDQVLAEVSVTLQEVLEMIDQVYGQK